MGAAKQQDADIVDVLLHVLVLIGIDVGTVQQSYFYDNAQEE